MAMTNIPAGRLQGVRVVCFAVFILCGLVLSAPFSEEVAAWEATVRPETTSVIVGRNVTFGVAFQNTGLYGISIESALLTIDWPGGPANASASRLPSGLGSGGGRTISWAVSVPSNLTPGSVHLATVAIECLEQRPDGTWENTTTTRRWSYDVSVSSSGVILPGGDGLALFTGFCFWILIILLVVAVVIIAIVARGRRRKNKPGGGW